VVLWCRDVRLLDVRGFAALASLADRIVLDNAPIGRVQAILREGQSVGDLAWTRLTRWREIIAQIFENPVYFSHLPSVRTVTITHAEAAPPVGVWYMAAWLQYCLELAGSQPRVSWAPGSEAGDGGISRIEFASGDPAVFEASVRKVEGAAAEVRVNALVNRTVFPEASDYVLLREELSISGRDPIYESSLARAAKLVEEP
jgi:glucose-6-phosphate dehydrogenase assembly protein OpcA